MVVQHNLTAMNANRMLGITTGSQAKSTEKLSSGFKINRAADDAAGLSISEKMRKQMRGLTQASANAQDGISAVQTAEGALNEVQDMLQRMNELAVKAANGTNSKDDRSYIQQEVGQLVTEIDRVATTTKFNETYLLKGVSKNDVVGELTFDDAKAVLNITYDNSGIGTIEGTEKTDGAIAAGKTIGDATVGTAGVFKYDEYTIAGTAYKVVKKITTQPKDNATPAADIDVTLKQAAEAANTDPAKPTYFESVDAMVEYVKANNPDIAKNFKSFEATDGGDLKVVAFADLNKAVDLSLHVGADSSLDNKINLSIEMMSARYLQINGLQVGGDTGAEATKAIDVIAEALQKVSSQRSTLGAVQNRLEHTIANLDNVVENTTSAESQIRDTDMATEMVRYSNNNILAQAGQAMLAQANQSNQGVLSLLQ